MEGHSAIPVLVIAHRVNSFRPASFSAQWMTELFERSVPKRSTQPFSSDNARKGPSGSRSVCVNKTESKLTPAKDKTG